jgi:hypothetical protein
VDEGVEDKLAQRGFGDRVGLYALKPRVGDAGDHVLRAQEINGHLDLAEQIALYFVVVADV